MLDIIAATRSAEMCSANWIIILATIGGCFLIRTTLAGLHIGRLDKRDDITNFPQAIGHTCRHRGRHAQRLMDANEVVIGREQRSASSAAMAPPSTRKSGPTSRTLTSLRSRRGLKGWLSKPYPTLPSSACGEGREGAADAREGPYSGESLRRPLLGPPRWIQRMDGFPTSGTGVQTRPASGKLSSVSVMVFKLRHPLRKLGLCWDVTPCLKP